MDCNYCGRDISPNATVCPRCGEHDPHATYSHEGDDDDDFFVSVVLPAIIGAIIGAVFFKHNGWSVGWGIAVCAVLGSNPAFLLVIALIAWLAW